MQVVWSPRAVKHLAQLRRYIAKENPKAASKVAGRIIDVVDLLATMPHAGRPGRVPGTREFVVADTPFIVIYRVVAKTLEIIAVLHGAQKWPAT
jgi:addiction module RelE/StbE family toxin